jgi:RNA polymerase sigma-70 factor (ECF subfamily)
MNNRIPGGGEQELITAILTGNSELYHRLILPYERIVYLLTLSYMKNEGEAEDIAQEIFIKAFRELAAFRGDSTFVVWLLSMAIQEARNRSNMIGAIDVAGKTQPEPTSINPALLWDWREISPQIIDRQNVRTLLRRAAQMLPADHLRIFLLREVLKLDIDATAQILGLCGSQVKLVSQSARMSLQRVLAPSLKAIDYDGSRA